MNTTVTISDEVIGGAPIRWQLEIADSRISVRELIRSRVYQEVQDVNLKRRTQAHTLVRIANDRSMAKDVGSIGNIDWKVHYEKAIEDYNACRFLLVVGDHQTESLDEELDMVQGTQVTFLKLVPLVGG